MRGIAHEQRIQREYLEALMESYARFFHEYDRSPLLIVNTTDIDPVNNVADYQLLHERIMEVRSGRHYYNPSVGALA